MGPTICSLVASLIDWIEGPYGGHGRPRCPTEAVVERGGSFCVKACNGANCGPPGSGLRGCGDAYVNGARRPCCAECTPRSFAWCAQRRKPRQTDQAKPD